MQAKDVFMATVDKQGTLQIDLYDDYHQGMMDISDDDNILISHDNISTHPSDEPSDNWGNVHNKIFNDSNPRQSE